MCLSVCECVFVCVYTPKALNKDKRRGFWNTFIFSGAQVSSTTPFQGHSLLDAVAMLPQRRDRGHLNDMQAIWTQTFDLYDETNSHDLSFIKFCKKRKELKETMTMITLKIKYVPQTKSIMLKDVNEVE